jgi:hypothetical protein
LRRPALDLGLELVMDRAPKLADWQALHELQPLGLKIRYVFCLTRDFDPVAELGSLAPGVTQNIFLFLPPKLHRQDSFLTPDEAFAVIERLNRCLGGREWPILRHYSDVMDAGHSLDPGEYRENFARLGSYPPLRRSLQVASERTWLVLPLIFLHRSLWLMHSPLAALKGLRSDLSVLSVYFIRGYWKVATLVAGLSGRFAYGAVSFFWKAHYVVHFIFWRTYPFLRWKLWPALRNPLWASEQYAPWLHRMVFLPAAKVYWFAEFQFRKRILGRNVNAR